MRAHGGFAPSHDDHKQVIASKAAENVDEFSLAKESCLTDLALCSSYFMATKIIANPRNKLRSV